MYGVWSYIWATIKLMCGLRMRTHYLVRLGPRWIWRVDENYVVADLRYTVHLEQDKDSHLDVENGIAGPRILNRKHSPHYLTIMLKQAFICCLPRSNGAVMQEKVPRRVIYPKELGSPYLTGRANIIRSDCFTLEGGRSPQIYHRADISTHIQELKQITVKAPLFINGQCEEIVTMQSGRV